MLRLLFLQVWTTFLPGAGGEIKTPEIKPQTMYELTLEGIIEVKHVGRRYDALSELDTSGNPLIPHTFFEIEPNLGTPKTSDAQKHIYTWEFSGNDFTGRSLAIRSRLAEKLSEDPRYINAGFSPDSCSKQTSGEIKITLSPKAIITTTSKEPESNSNWMYFGLIAGGLAVAGYLATRPKKEDASLIVLEKEVLKAADALSVSAKKREVLRLGDVIRDATFSAGELRRVGNQVTEFLRKNKKAPLQQEENSLKQRMESAKDDEAKQSLKEAAEEKSKALAAITQAEAQIERIKARLTRLRASLESARVVLDAPSSDNKSDESALSSLRGELKLAHDAVQEAESTAKKVDN